MDNVVIVQDEPSPPARSIQKCDRCKKKCNSKGTHHHLQPNRLGLPYIPLKDNYIYKQAKKRKTQQPPWLEPIETVEPELSPEARPYFSINTIYKSKLINEKSRITRDNKIKEFKLWLEDRRSRNLYAPTIDEIKKLHEAGDTVGKEKFLGIIPLFFEYRFNLTYNKPNSFNADLNAIKHMLLTEVGWSTNNLLHYAWFKDFKQGIKNVCTDVLKKDGVKPKLAIFNPILEAMLKCTNHLYIKLGMLLAQRFCFRAQHYLQTESKADFVTLGQIKFRYKSDGSVQNMSIYNKRDKNNV